MDTPPNKLCGICDAQHITKSADFWCPECDDGLCTECKTHHSFSKSSRQHGVISIEDYRNLSTDISNIVHHCVEHYKKLQKYCPHHDQLCCLLCISTSHKDCTGMLPIDEMAKTSKSSGLLETLQKSLEDLKSNIDNVVKDRQSNLTKIREQRQNILAGIQNLRKKINSHFDKIEQEIEKELNASECDLKTKIEDMLHGLKEKRERIAVLQSNITDLKNHASDLQTFIGSKKLVEQIESEETYVQSLPEDERLKQLSLKCTIDERIEIFLQNITSFGLVSMESSPPSVEIKLEKIKQAQMMSASFIPKSVCDVRATFLRKIQIPKGKSNTFNITSCGIFSNGKFIFADCEHNMRLVVLDTDASFDYEVPFSELRPYSVACIDDTTVAFTAWKSSEIYLYDLTSKFIKNTFKTNGVCFGIAHHDGMLYYGSKDSVSVTQIEGGMSSTIMRLDYIDNGWRNIALFGESIYFTNHANNSVSCFNVQGRKLWDYKDDEILNGPNSLAVGKYGIVYVALKQKQSIVAVSPDGNTAVNIISSKDGIENPFKLAYDNVRDVLIVASYRGNCALFEIHYMNMMKLEGN